MKLGSYLLVATIIKILNLNKDVANEAGCTLFAFVYDAGRHLSGKNL